MLAVFSMAAIQVASPSTANAWCENNSIWNTFPAKGLSNTVEYDSQCAKDNWDSIPSDPTDTGTNKRGITYDEYQSLIDKCGSDTAGLDATEKDCANAISNCLQTSVDLGLCKNSEKMADITQFLAGCNGGKTFDCNEIHESNKQLIETAQQNAVNKARAGCDLTGVDKNSVNAINARLTECENAFRDKSNALGCSNNFVNDGNRYNEIQDGINKGGACLNQALIASAKNEIECKARGGVAYVEPGSAGSTLNSSACKANYSDIKSEADCKKAGGTWVVQSHTSICQAPIDKNDNGTDKASDDPNAGEIKVDNGGVNGDCSGVRTNIISCNTSSTAGGVLNDLLKIIISVLSVLIGIAAVGGLAWAAVMYAKAEDDSSKVSEAKTMVRNVVIGLLLYGFLIAIVNWLIPGSVIGNGSGGGWFG